MIRVAVVLLLVTLGLVLLANVAAPTDPSAQDRAHALTPPFWLDAPAEGPLFLLGTDELGRDLWSRLLHGGRVSLLWGVLAAAISLAVGTLLGTLAGYSGGWLDALLMRLAELFLGLPWLYMLLGLRAALPLSMTPETTFLLLAAVIGVLGWARPARLVRGVVLSVREREYVGAARRFGASGWYIARTHILPELRSLLATQAAVLIPGYIVAEVTLSFLGLGAGEPLVSWGSLLGSLRQVPLLLAHQWMSIPAPLLVPVFISINALANHVANKR